MDDGPPEQRPVPAGASTPGDLPAAAGDLPAAAGDLPAAAGDLPAAAAVLAASVVLGVAVGLLWRGLSPVVHVVVTPAGPDLADTGGDGLFAVDGTFALLGAAAGLMSGVAAWFGARRRRGPVLLAGLALGGLVCGLVAWQVGRQIGLTHYHALLHSTVVGRRFTKPVDLRSKAALLPQPFFAAAAYLVLAAWVARPDLGRRPPPPAGGVRGAGQAGEAGKPGKAAGAGGASKAGEAGKPGKAGEARGVS